MMKAKKLLLSVGLLGLLGSSVASLSAFTSSAHAVGAAAVSEEPAGYLHLETGKIKGYTEYGYETMTGHDGNEVTAYVFKAGGGTSANPEVRFVNSGTQTVSSPYTLVAEDSVTNVHFWYKLTNSAEKNVNDIAKPYILQVLASDKTYPIYDFTPINDGEWHPWLMTLRSSDVSKFCGFIVKAGDIDGSLTISNVEINKTSTKDFKDVISFSGSNFDYNNIGDFFVRFAYSEQIFKNDNFGESSYYDTGNAFRFVDEDGAQIDLTSAIEINGHDLNYWRSLDTSSTIYPRTDGLHSFPTSVGGQYDPVAIEFLSTYVEFKFNMDYIPMVNTTVTFKASLFRAYNKDTGTTYELSEDLKFHSTLGDDTAHHNGIKFTLDDLETETEFTIDRIDNWSANYPFLEYVVWTNVPRSSLCGQSWPHDNYRYLFNDILIDDLPVSYYQNWGRGNCHDYPEGDWSNPVQEYYTESPAAGNRNYTTVMQMTQFVDQPNFTFAIRIPYKLMEDFGKAYPQKISIRKGAIWYLSDGEGGSYRAVNTKQDDSYIYQNPTDVSIQSLSVSEIATSLEKPIGLLELNTDANVSSIGYDFSDKALNDARLDDFLVNGKTIRTLNSDYASQIPQKDYDIPYFNAYGVVDGVPNASRLTVPFIIHCSEAKIRIMVHPTVWEQIKNDNVTVEVKGGFSLIDTSADKTLFKLVDSFSSDTDTYYLDLLVASLHLDDYNENLGYCADAEHGYYAIAKAKYLSLSSTAKTKFLNESEYASAYARFLAWADANGDVVSSTGITAKPSISLLLGSSGEGSYALWIALGSLSALVIAGLFLIKKRKHNR